MSMPSSKPLRGKAFGTIPHLIGSNRGPGDWGVNEGVHRICTEQLRDRHDELLVQPKLDGTNVAIAKVDGRICAVVRSGHLAQSSPHEQHQLFAAWVREHAWRVFDLLTDGEWISGEWLAMAHGVRHNLDGREPFVAFDLRRRVQNAPVSALYDELVARVGDALTVVPVLHRGGALSTEQAIALLGAGTYGEIDPPEGVVYRVERFDARPQRRVRELDIVAKYVRADFVPGRYFPELSGTDAVWNWRP
jgi:RNA ligase